MPRIDGHGNGVVVVDSGTTLSFLAEPAYGKILAAFRLSSQASSNGERSHAQVRPLCECLRLGRRPRLPIQPVRPLCECLTLRGTEVSRGSTGLTFNPNKHLKEELLFISFFPD
ncbi:hypothetical protein GYH30_028139 [Glycine max]|nr:hypothetical protein GYH30_028139 [Glycine max]